MMSNFKKQISQTGKEIDNIVSVMAKTASEALIDKLAELERTKKEMQYRLEKLEAETQAYSISEQEVSRAFEKARQLLKTGELKQTKAIVERYVQKIIIHPDRIEVKLNFDIRTGCFEEEIKKEPLNPTDQSDYSKELFLIADTSERRVFDGGERGS